MQDDNKVQLIEQTGKRWKLIILVGGSLLAFGMILILLSMGIEYQQFLIEVEEGSKKPVTANFLVSFCKWLGVVLVIFGLPTTIVAKFGAWWYHG